MTSDNGFAANPVNGDSLNTATNSIPNSSEKVNTENGIAEEVAKTVRNKAFASRSGMAAQSILNKIKAGETPADSEINELVYAAINDRELVQRAIDHGMAQNNDSQAFAVASRLEKKLAKNKSVSVKDFKELILSEFFMTANEKNASINKPKVKFSIASKVQADDGNEYENVVLLDRNIFHSGNKSKDLHNFVYNNLAGMQIAVTDEAGTKSIIEFARQNDRVKKDGAKNSHPVLGKLTSKKDTRGQLTAVHADEIVYVSKEDNSQPDNVENNHQWLDANGWNFRKAVFAMPNGEIFECVLNIANARDGRKILYDINKIKNIGRSTVPLSALQNGSITIPDVDKIVSHKNTFVNSNYTQKSENDTKYTEEKRIKFESTARNVNSLKDGYGSYTKEQVRSFRRVADAFGIDVFVGNDNELGADGYYVRSHNGERAKIYLNAGGTNPLNAVIRHEVIHHIKATSIDAFNTFSNYVTERYIELYGEEAFEETLSEISDTYRTKTGKELTRAESIDEFCADVGMDMFRSPSEAKRLAFADRNVLQRFLDAIREVLRKIEGVFSNEWDYSFKRLSALESTATATEDGTVYHSHNTASESFMPLDVESLKEAERVLAEVLKENGGTAFSFNSKNDIENSEEKNYNNNISFLAGKRKAFRPKYNWHTGLTHDQVSKVEKWVKNAGAPDSNRIVGNAYWYTGRLNGSDLFVIYSDEDTEPTVMYLSRGQKAKDELTEIKDVLEEIRNVGKSSYVSWVSVSGWMQRQNGTANSFANKRRTNNTNAGVLPGQPKGITSGALRTLLDNLFRDREYLNNEQSNKEIDLSVTNVSVASTSESTDESLIPIEEFQRNEEYIPVTSKNRDIYRHNVNKMFRKAQSLFSVPYGEARKHIKPIIEEMAAKLMNNNGHISDEDYFNLTVELIG